VADPEQFDELRRRVDDPASHTPSDSAATSRGDFHHQHSDPATPSSALTSEPADDSFARALAALDALLGHDGTPPDTPAALPASSDAADTERALGQLEAWLAAIVEERESRRHGGQRGRRRSQDTSAFPEM
jgi:hypothetical protein